MPMHQGFDLSRFKKVSSDAKSTTMRHSNGHEVKIVHSALSPAMRAQVDSLPTAEAPVKAARGGMVKKYANGTPDAPVAADPQAMDPASPATADDSNVADLPVRRLRTVPPPPIFRQLRTQMTQTPTRSTSSASRRSPSRPRHRILAWTISRAWTR